MCCLFVPLYPAAAVVLRYAALLSACEATLEDLLQLHNTLAQQHPAAAAALAAADQQALATDSKKRSRETPGSADSQQQQQNRQRLQQQQQQNKYAGCCCSAADAWQAVDAAVNNLAGFRDASLDKWHRRTVLSSGTAALRGSSGLRALHQSVSSQVAALMADKHKLISRSQLPSQLAPRPLGQPAAAAAAVAAGDLHSDDEAAAAAAGSSSRDPETYDEGDFYQQLLRELLDSGEQVPDACDQLLRGNRRQHNCMERPWDRCGLLTWLHGTGGISLWPAASPCQSSWEAVP